MKKVFLSLILILGILVIPMDSFSKTRYYNDYAKYPKVIRVNTYANMLTYYEYGKKIGELHTSVGDKKNYTPEGRFRITNKHEFMYSQSAGTFMPFWMEFWKGKYGIHALAEDAAGNLESNSIIGTTAAGGCVRLNKIDAKTLYTWADLGTYILIAYDKNEFVNIDEDKQTISTYYSLINAGKYEEAFLMKANKTSSLQTLTKAYQGLSITINNITQIHGGEYNVNLTYLKSGKTSQAKAKFFISKGKIVRSFNY